LKKKNARMSRARIGSASKLPPVDLNCLMATNTMLAHDSPDLKLDQSLRG
jgi:hypothetical protein